MVFEFFFRGGINLVILGLFFGGVMAVISSFYASEPHKIKNIITDTFAVIFCMALFCGFIFLIISPALPPKQTKNIQGTALHLSAYQTELGSSLFMIVELNNGKKIKAYMTRKFPFKKGDKVNIFMKTPYIGKIVYYVKS